MTNITEKKIEQIALEIKSFLDKHYLNGYCRIYFNGKCLDHGAEDNILEGSEWKEIENIDPKDYFDYAGGIISMSFEGSFYDVVNDYYTGYYSKLQAEFIELLSKHGYYYELGNAWNLSIYEIYEEL